MKLIAFGASSSKNSINKKLATHAADVFKRTVKPETDIEILDLNEFEMPLYSIDREEADGIPAAAQLFLDKINDADAVIISFAEHNGSYSVAYKNVFDWASRINAKVFQDTPMVFLSTGPGGGGAKNTLAAAVNSAPHFNAIVKGSLSVPSFYANFDSDSGVLKDEALAEQLLKILKKLV